MKATFVYTSVAYCPSLLFSSLASPHSCCAPRLGSRSVVRGNSIVIQKGVLPALPFRTCLSPSYLLPAVLGSDGINSSAICTPSRHVSSNGQGRPSGPSSSAITVDTLLRRLYGWIERHEVRTAGDVLGRFYGFSGPTSPTFSLKAMVSSRPGDARDVVTASVRLYTRLGQMEHIRAVFTIALEEFSSAASPFSLLNVHFFNLYFEVLTLRKQYDPAEVMLIMAEMKRRDVEPDALTYHYLVEIHVRAGYHPRGLWDEMKRKGFSAPSAVSPFFLNTMLPTSFYSSSISSLSSGYMSVARLPRGNGGKSHTGLRPLPATLQTLLLRVLPNTGKTSRSSRPASSQTEAESADPLDPLFSMEVIRAALQYGGGGPSTKLSSSLSYVLTKRQMVEVIEDWLSLKGKTGESVGKSKQSGDAASNSKNSSSSGGGSSAAVPVCNASALSKSYPPEYIMWLLMELEVRCVLEKASFVQFIQKRHVVWLLLHCAKCGDAITLSQVLALMDRHLMRRTADTGALTVWCYSQALWIEPALDTLLWMERKGYLESGNSMQFLHRYTTVDTIRYTMDRHFMMCFVDALNTPALVERALRHLRRHSEGLAVYEKQLVSKSEIWAGKEPSTGRVERHSEQSAPHRVIISAHILDLVVLSYAKIGCEREGMALIQAYETFWGTTPGTNTLNALLMGLQLAFVRRRTGGGAGMYHRDAFIAMSKQYPSVVPNALTYKLLIRQAVLCDHIDEAVEYLQLVGGGGSAEQGLPPAPSSVRVEVEMVLPILERAARAGDGETAQILSQFALDCDIGIDPAVLQTAMSQLTQAGQSVEVLRGHVPLHEALRSRSKVGRQRARATSIRL